MLRVEQHLLDKGQGLALMGQQERLLRHKPWACSSSVSTGAVSRVVEQCWGSGPQGLHSGRGWREPWKHPPRRN